MQDDKPNREHKEDEPSPEFENFQKVLERVLSVPKKDVDEQIKRERDERKREREKREREKRAG